MIVRTVLRGRSVTSTEGSVGFCAVYLVTTPDARILFDTGHVGRRRGLLRALTDLELTPADIDVVVLSHAHWDHVQNADLFTTVLIHADEPAYAESPGDDDLVTPSWTANLLRHIGVRTVGDREPVAAGVHTLHLPGHTAGSMGLVVEAPDGRHVLTGDAVSSAAALHRGQSSIVHHDADQARASVELVATLADVVWPGHDRPFAIRDRKPGEYLEDDTSLEFRGG
jgi:glyoxylase-like metal-dependent hydrolase (beta-lactamase superfamily II)